MKQISQYRKVENKTTIQVLVIEAVVREQETLTLSFRRWYPRDLYEGGVSQLGFQLLLIDPHILDIVEKHKQ